MTYQFVVFDPEVAPAEMERLVVWLEQQDVTDDDPESATVPLRNWVSDFQRNFPPINTPFARDDGNTSYEFGRAFIRVRPVDADPDEAADGARQLAAKHEVGYYNANPGHEKLFYP